MPDADLIAQAQRFDEAFLHEFSGIIDAVAKAVLEERAVAREMVDRDPIEAFRSFKSTLTTLSIGLYYESLPQGGSIQVALFRRIRAALDAFLEPRRADQRVLRVSEAISVLEFFVSTAQLKTSARPKNRVYLDWLQSIYPETKPSEESSRLIIP